MRQGLLQRSFDHVIKQGKPSIDSKNCCMYRSADGTSCAAAIFITEYDEDMEDKSWKLLIDTFKEKLLPEAVEEADFIYIVLQGAHDTAAFSSRMNPETDFLTTYKSILKDHIEDWNNDTKDNIQLPEGF